MPDLSYLDKYVKPSTGAPADDSLGLGKYVPAPPPSVLSESVKAPARVLGGIAQEAGEAAQYLTGDRAGIGIRKWGEGVQERNAQTPAFREAHPVLSTAGDVVEGVAKMAPYLAADLLVPEVAAPATLGAVARGVRAVKAAPFATGVLPAVAGLSQGQRSYEKGVANGLTPDQALAASAAPAAVTGVGMAAMGALSHGLQNVGGAAKSLGGQFVKHAAADTSIMMGQGVATSAAEKATGIDPEARPLDQLKDPKAWLNAALTGGMFAGIGVAKKGLVAKALKEHLDTLGEAAPEERAASVEALAQAVHPEDTAAQAMFQADTLDKIQAGEPVLSEDLVTKLTTEPPVAETRESVLKGLQESVESGGEVNPLEAHNAAEEAKVVEALKVEVPAPAEQAAPEEPVKMREGSMPGVNIPAAPEESVALTRAKRWIKDGFTPVREGAEPDPEVAAHLDDMGYTLVKGERADRTSGGSVARREWRVEKKPEPFLDPQSFPDTDSWKKSLPPEQLAEVNEYEDLRYKTTALQGPEKGYKPYKLTAKEKARLSELDQKYSQAYVRKAEPAPQAAPEVSAASLADGEVRRLSEREAIARQGDTLILGNRNAKGEWDHVAKADLHKDGHFEVSASESETPEAAARMVSVLRELGMGREAERLNRAEGTGLPKADIDAHLEGIISKLKVPVEVVNSANEIAGLRPDAPKFNGAFHQGKIYLNAEHIASLKEAEHVLLKHELAHAGLRGVMGDKGLNDVLAKAWGDVNSGVREFAKEKGIETRTKAGKLEATEEYLVHLAESGAKHPLWDKFVATLKAAMRKLGFDMKYSDSELRSLVVEATRSMRSGEGPTRFSRLTDAVTASPAFKKWFGDSKVVDAEGKPLMVYHGSGGDFSRFDGSMWNPDVAGHFTPNVEDAERFAADAAERQNFPGDEPENFASVYPVYLRAEKPFDFENSQHVAEVAKLAKVPAERLSSGLYDVMESEGVTTALKKLGYDSYYEREHIGGTKNIAVFSPKQIKSATGNNGEFDPANPDIRFARLSLKPKTKDVDDVSRETTIQVVKRVLSDISGNTWRAIMPIDKTIKMAQSIPTYAPIRENLTRLQELRRFKDAAGTAPSIEAKHITDDVARVVRTPEALKAYNDLTHKATLYELHADPSKPLPWTEKSWKEAGKQKQTGLSLGQAAKEVRDLWNALTPEQREVQQRAVAHMKELKKEHIEAQLSVLQMTFAEDTFAQAEKVAETLSKEMWKAEQIGGAEGAGMRRAELATQHGADVMHLAEQIAAIKHEGQLKGDYAPLMRFGDHIVSTFVKTAGGEGKRLEVRHFESKGEAMAEVRKIQSDPTKMATYALQPEAQRSVVNIPLEFLNKMQAAMDAKGIDPAQQEALMQDFKAARLSTMPRNSLEGHRLNREGIAGYEDSAVRSYAAYVQRASRTIANLKYGTKIDQTFRDMDNNIKAYQDPEQKWDPQAVERMSSLKDNLYTLEKQHNTEKINEITKAIGKSTFLWYLSSPSVWAVQWSQPFVTTIPKMASRYGFGRAFSSYVSEAKNFMAGHFSDEKIDAFDRAHEAVGKRVFDLIEQYREAVTMEEKAKLSREMKSIYDGFSERDQKLLILKVMSHQGAIDLSAAHSLHDLVNSSDVFNKGIDYLVDKGGVFMRASETGSRRAAAVSAFQMALRDKKDFMAANDYASHIIDDTLFDFSSQNRAAIMKGNVGRVVGQFQFFRLHMLGKTIQLAKDAYRGEFKQEARKELAYMMGTSMALAGAGGTPLAMLAGSTVSQAIWDAASFLFGDPDDPWDPKADFESAMKDAVGEDATNTFMKGLPYLMGVDVSKRIGLGGMANVIQGEVPPGASPTDRANWYAAKLLGPSWGLVTDSMKTFDALGNGDYGTAMQAGSPKVVRDFMKAYDVSQDGVKGPGGRTVLQSEEVNPFSVALQMVGINPADISLAQEEAREFKNATTELKQRRSLLMKRVTEATLAGDMDAREEALEAVNAWGEKQPALKITVRELATAVKRGMDLKAGKMSRQDERLKAEAE